MLSVDTPQEMKAHVGRELGVSDWLTVDQDMIDKFADATGDHQWIHVDVERAAREMPNGATIAHGYLTLSLVPRMAKEILEIKNRSRGINYGSNKVRFTGMVPAGARIRLRQTLKACDDVDGGGVRLISEMQVEREGADRPVLVGEVISLVYG